MNVRSIALSTLILCLGTGCEGCEEQLDSCDYAGNGVCDEPANWRLAAILPIVTKLVPQGATRTSLRRLAITETGNAPRFSDAVGSGGEETATGTIDGYLMVPSGCNAAVAVPCHYRLYVPSNYDPPSRFPWWS